MLICSTRVTGVIVTVATVILWCLATVAALTIAELWSYVLWWMSSILLVFAGILEGYLSYQSLMQRQQERTLVSLAEVDEEFG